MTERSPRKHAPDDSAEGPAQVIASEPATRSSTDRPPTHVLQLQPTLLTTERKRNRPKSTKDDDLALECTNPRNVVIFGDSGVGKSSLINMLAGHEVAETSDSAIGCTSRNTLYTIEINGEMVNVWDTPGLNEGSWGRVLPKVAEKELTKLLHWLRRAGGIHLLVYCMRGRSVRKTLARNYVIFYSAICRKKVPIVAVVTGLENQLHSMDDWWTTGRKVLAEYKMVFDDHACVTTVGSGQIEGSRVEQRRIESQQLVQKLIIDNCHRIPTRVPSDNISITAALRELRAPFLNYWTFLCWGRIAREYVDDDN